MRTKSTTELTRHLMRASFKNWGKKPPMTEKQRREKARREKIDALFLGAFRDTALQPQLPTTENPIEKDGQNNG